MRTPRALSILLCACLGACGSPAPSTVAQAAASCARGSGSLEVRDAGSVVRVLGIRRSRSGLHEGFIVRFATSRVLVEDNVDMTGSIPLHSGERLELQGQYECNDGVIHWTHHDPRGRHPSGYIDAGGSRYQ